MNKSLINIIIDNILLFFGDHWTDAIRRSIIHNIKVDLRSYSPRYFKRKFGADQQTYINNLDIDLWLDDDNHVNCYLDSKLILSV